MSALSNSNENMESNPTITAVSPLFSVPSDPSFIHPVDDFPSLSVFEEKIIHPALIVPAKQTASLRNRLSHVMMHRPKIKSVYPVDGDASVRKLVLQNLPNDKNVYEDPVVQQVFQESSDVAKSTYSLHLTYPDWTVEEVLRKLLPLREIPSAFEMVGSIAHINLREDALPFQYMIGKVILDKNTPRIKTVVNKLASIDTKYRTFGMHVIAGKSNEGWSEVELKEEGCTYQLDFQQVYWNSRLAGEHRRIVQLIRKEAKNKDKVVVADLMAGIGPFCVPLTATKTPNNHCNNIVVYANDLNPTSYKYLQINSKKNKCEHLQMYNIDGRQLVHQLQDESVQVHHFIMNLPASAPECLDAFRGYSCSSGELPRLHVHCFAPKTGNWEEQALERCSTALQCRLDRQAHNVRIHVVRDVAPTKNMLCVSFTLPQEVSALPRVVIEDDAGAPATKEGSEEPDTKRAKR